MNPQYVTALISTAGSLASAAVAAIAIRASSRGSERTIRAQQTTTEEHRLWERRLEVYLEALAWMGQLRFQEQAVLPPSGFEERVTAFCPVSIREPLLVMTETMRLLRRVQESHTPHQGGRLESVLLTLHPKVAARIRHSLQGPAESHGVRVVHIMGEMLDGEPALFGVDDDEERAWPLYDYATSLDESS